MADGNIYDDPDFHAGYVTLDRQVRGLAGAAEWPVLQTMVPPLGGARVVDLGCGFGWFSRWAVEQGAVAVLGVDVSTRMLERARADTDMAAVTYQQHDLQQLTLAPDSADLVFSSLALHYVKDLARLLSVASTALAPGGSLVFSVEHPIFSAPTSQGFETSAAGDQVWPLNDYLVEGERNRTWFVDGVVKHHRTFATWLNAVIAAGCSVERVVEWGPSPADIEERPELAQDLHRPWFLLIGATKLPAQTG